MNYRRNHWLPERTGQDMPAGAVNLNIDYSRYGDWAPMSKEAANTSEANTAKYNTANPSAGTAAPAPAPAAPKAQPLQSKEHYAKVMKDIESNKPREQWTDKDYQDYYGADYDRHISMYGGVTPNGFGTREDYINRHTSRMQNVVANGPAQNAEQNMRDDAMRQRNIAEGNLQLQREMQRDNRIAGKPYDPSGVASAERARDTAWEGLQHANKGALERVAERGPARQETVQNAQAAVDVGNPVIRDRMSGGSNAPGSIVRRVDENGQVRTGGRANATVNTADLSRRFSALAASMPYKGVHNLTDNYVPAGNLDSKEDYDEAYNWLINNGSAEAQSLAAELYRDGQARFGGYGSSYIQ